MPKVSAEKETKVMPITVKEFLQKQAEDPFCKQADEGAGQPGSQYSHESYWFLVRKSELNGRLQRVVSKRPKARVLYPAHYPRLAGQLGGSSMYFTLRWEYR